MKLADVSIERPVFATMMIFALIVLGLFSYMKLNIDMYPDVDIPFVTVTTVLRGAGPEQIETDVTKKIEDAVNPVAGVDHIQSTCQEGLSIVVIQFKLEIDGRTAAQEVREKVAAARANLPTEIEDPVITRFDPASLPILTLTVSGSRSGKAITTFTKDVIKKRLENVPGVGAVDLVGGDEREIQVAVDAAKLRAYSLSIEDVIASVGAANMEVPAGSLINGPRDRHIARRTHCPPFGCGGGERRGEGADQPRARERPRGGRPQHPEAVGEQHGPGRRGDQDAD